jgi:hypothetical protein
VRLTGDSNALETLAREHNQESLSVSQESDGYYLTSSDFEPLPNGQEVREHGLELIRIIRGIYRQQHGWCAAIEDDGYIYRVSDEGSRTGYITRSASIRAVATLIVTGTVEPQEQIPAPSGPNPSERRYNLARRYPEVADVLTFFDSPGPRAVNLFKVYELIRDDVGDEGQIVKNGWASGRKLRRFTNSLNNRQVLGAEARHASMNHDAPKKPMLLAEADDFMRSLLEQWLDWKEAQAAGPG